MTAAPSFLSLARQSFWLLFGGIWFLVGTAMLVGAAAFGWEEIRFATRPETATGTVVEKGVAPPTDDRSAVYWLTYSFSPSSGGEVRRTDDVSPEDWRAVSAGGPITIYYLGDAPARARLTRSADLVGLAIFLLLALVFAPIGGFLVFRSIRDILTVRRLHEHGQPATATITGLERTNVSVNGRPQFRIHYTYRDPAGRSHKGRSGYLGWAQATDWNEGDTIAIRYDPARPTVSHWSGERPGAASTQTSG